MKFGQLTEHNTRKIFFFKNHAESEAEKPVQDHILFFLESFF